MISGYDALRSYPTPHVDTLSFSPNPAYEQYLRIHKVLVGPKTALTLEKIADSLGQETLPRYVVAAGWAAMEASLAQPHRSSAYRHQLLDQAEIYWQQALETQVGFNYQERSDLVEYSAAYRTALDLARLPLIRGVVDGYISPELRSSVRENTLTILDDIAVQMHYAASSGEVECLNDLIGVLYEGNTLAALDSFDSPSLFGISSFARSDSGHHHPDQSHDIIVIQQKGGMIKAMTPLEIKSKASVHDRNRYKALIVRGKMHLCINGFHSPHHTTKAFSALYAGNQTKQEAQTTDSVRRTLSDMFWLYKCGPALFDIASSRSSLLFHNREHMRDAYPEITAA